MCFSFESAGEGQSNTIEHGPAVAANGVLWVGRDQACEGYSVFQGLTDGGSSVDETDGKSFVGQDRTSRQQNVECAAKADYPRQLLCTAVDEGHSPTTFVASQLCGVSGDA